MFYASEAKPGQAFYGGYVFTGDPVEETVFGVFIIETVGPITGGYLTLTGRGYDTDGKTRPAWTMVQPDYILTEWLS